MSELLSLLKEMDIAKMLPDIEVFLLQLEKVLRVIVMVGPLTILGLGLWYYLAPPKEANHRAGFRTYWGMGSIAAWRYTQRIAGMYYSVMGFGLTVVLSIFCNFFRAMEPMTMAVCALVCVLVEVVLILGVWVWIQVQVYRKFDKDGNLRKEL